MVHIRMWNVGMVWVWGYWMRWGGVVWMMIPRSSPAVKSETQNHRQRKHFLTCIRPSEPYHKDLPSWVAFDTFLDAGYKR